MLLMDQNKKKNSIYKKIQNTKIFYIYDYSHNSNVNITFIIEQKLYKIQKNNQKPHYLYIYHVIKCFKINLEFPYNYIN